MSTTPARYQPDPRLIDQPAQLRELYEDRELTIREIADNHADVGRTAVGDALQEYGITDNDTTDTDEHEDNDASSQPSRSARGLAPPQSGGANNIDWAQTRD